MKKQASKQSSSKSKSLKIAVTKQSSQLRSDSLEKPQAKGVKIKPPKFIRQDSSTWYNVMTGLGRKGIDRNMGARFAVSNFLQYNELTQLYLGEGLAKRIVDLVPDEMTRQWFTVEGDTDNACIAKLDEMNARVEVTNLLKWSRLYGGCLGVMGIDDGGKLTDPVNENNIRDVKFIHLFDRFNVWWTTTDLYSNINSPKYGTPEIYHITPYHGGVQFPIHESRVLRLQGEVLPTRLMILNQGWGSSILQATLNVIRNMATAYDSAANIVQDFVQTTIKVQNLSEMIAAGQSNLINQRLSLIDTSRSVANTIILDALEDYNKSASSVAGLSDLLDRFSLKVCSVTGIPYTLLMGQGVKGLNATGDADIRLFYDKIKADQERILQPALHRLCRLIMLSKQGPFRGKEIDSWKIKFNPLWQMSEQETAVYRYQVAQADVAYVNAGVLDPTEVAESRWGGGSYSPDTVIDVENRVDPSMTDEERKQFEDFKKQSETGIVTTGKGIATPEESLEKEQNEPASQIMM